MNGRKLSAITAACALALLCNGQANAATTTADFIVSVTVTNSCTVEATDMVFPDPGVFSTDVDASSTVTVRCTMNTPYRVHLNEGIYHAGPGERRMQNAGTYVGYELYSDAARTTVWGLENQYANGNSFGSVVTGTGTGLNEGLTVYGRIPPQTAVGAGTYTDTVTATISY